jgi:hypothetical protein
MEKIDISKIMKGEDGRYHATDAPAPLRSLEMVAEKVNELIDVVSKMKQ